MRLAVFHNLPSGGAKRALYGLGKYLTRAGWDLDVYLPSTADEEFLGLAGIARDVRVLPVRTTLRGAVRSAIRYLPPIPPLHVSLADLEAAQARAAETIDRGGYDAVLVEQDRFTMAPFILHHLRLPTVYFCQQPSRLHEAVLGEVARPARQTGWRGALQRTKGRYAEWKLDAIDRRNAKAARFVLANSYFSREEILRAYGLNAAVCYLGVDPEVFRRRELEREAYVLSVGFLGPWKGYEFLVRALARIEPAVRPPLVIVANGELPGWRQYLERLASDLGVALSIRMRVSDGELLDLYGRAKLLVYAPYLEPFGLAPVEAMACDTPVVAVREGGVREIVVDGETGLLTERDEEVFAGAVRELLSDDARRLAMASRAVERVAAFWTLRHAVGRLIPQIERTIRLW